jgi:serine/threonine-protein kinase HipA
MKRLDVRLTGTPVDWMPVGTLAESERRVYFEYSPEMLQRQLPLSPFRLPARPGLHEHTDTRFGPLPGLFDDSLPDGWGLLLMDRHFQRLGLELGAVSALDRLAWLGTATMGALTYHPPADREAVPPALDLGELARNSREVLAGETAEVLPQLVRAGGSPGGARPKILVGLRGPECVSGEDDLPAGFEPWIVKFRGRQDPVDMGPIEHAYALMARAAGLEVPATRLLEAGNEGMCFAVERFDRAAEGRRRHVHTFGNLIHADHRVPSCDYRDLLKVTGVLTRHHTETLRVLRQMVFNLLAHNRDDHVKNFAFCLEVEAGAWSVTPAYDLVYADGPGGEHTMTVAGEGRAPTREHVLACCREASISAREAEGVIEEVQEAVAGWARFAEQAGVTRRSRQRVSAGLARVTFGRGHR